MEMCVDVLLFGMYVVRQNNILDLDRPSNDKTSINMSNGDLCRKMESSVEEQF